MNFAAIVLSFVLGLGVVLLLISEDATVSLDEDGMTTTAGRIMKAVGIILMVIGTIGFAITLVDVVRRAHRRLSQGEKGKLEEQIHRKATRSATQTQPRTTSIAVIETNGHIV
ncbi:unnamed protein product, partial [Mesorhabditis spiculigera]